MATVQTILEAAYVRSTANDPGKLTVDGEMVATLNRQFQMLYAIKAVSAPDAHVARVNLSALSGSPAAATLPSETIDIRRIQSSGGTKVNLIPVEDIDRTWHLAPAVYRQGASLVSRGLSGDPIATDVLTIWHLDAPTALTALANTIDTRFESRFHELLIISLAIYMSTKDVDRDAGEFQKLVSERQIQLEAFFKLCGLSMTALQTPHGSVIIQKLNAALGLAGTGK